MLRYYSAGHTLWVADQNGRTKFQYLEEYTANYIELLGHRDSSKSRAKAKSLVFGDKEQIEFSPRRCSSSPTLAYSRERPEEVWSGVRVDYPSKVVRRSWQD